MSDAIDQFGALLTQLVRDQAIAACDGYLDPAAWGPTGRQWRNSVPQEEVASAVEAIRYAIPDIVDETVFRVLLAVDNGEFALSFATPDGESVDLTESGELAGWYSSPPDEGWRGHSQERVNP